MLTGLGLVVRPGISPLEINFSFFLQAIDQCDEEVCLYRCEVSPCFWSLAWSLVLVELPGNGLVGDLTTRERRVIGTPTGTSKRLASGIGTDCGLNSSLRTRSKQGAAISCVRPWHILSKY